jgi:hypothetical protein
VAGRISRQVAWRPRLCSRPSPVRSRRAQRGRAAGRVSTGRRVPRRRDRGFGERDHRRDEDREHGTAAVVAPEAAIVSQHLAERPRSRGLTSVISTTAAPRKRSAPVAGTTEGRKHGGGERRRRLQRGTAGQDVARPDEPRRQARDRAGRARPLRGFGGPTRTTEPGGARGALRSSAEAIGLARTRRWTKARVIWRARVPVVGMCAGNVARRVVPGARLTLTALSAGNVASTHRRPSRATLPRPPDARGNPHPCPQ